MGQKQRSVLNMRLYFLFYNEQHISSVLNYKIN